MEIFIALCVTFGIFAVGDILGVATKAKVSSVFVALLIFLVGFMSGIIPEDIIEKSTLDIIAKWSGGYIVFHMGTMINIKQLISEWRTVVLTILSMIVAALALCVLIPVIGLDKVLVSIPIVNGGMIATQIMTEKALAIGLPTVAALGAILYAIQKFVGTPIASFFGLKEANLVLEDIRANKIKNENTTENNEEKDSKQLFYQKYEKYFTDFVCLGVTALFVLFSSFIAEIINGGIQSVVTDGAFSSFSIHYTIICLIVGAIVGYLGLVPPKVLEKGKSSGFFSVAIFASIIPSLSKIKLNDLMGLSLDLIIIFVVVLAALFIVFYFLPVGKLIGSRNLAVGIAMGQLLGFPATYLISQEIAKAVTDDPEEQAIVLEKISSRYVIAGFASVTTFSIFTAGLLVGFL